MAARRASRWSPLATGVCSVKPRSVHSFGEVLILAGQSDFDLTQAIDAFARSGVTTFLVNPCGDSVAAMVRASMGRACAPSVTCETGEEIFKCGRWTHTKLGCREFPSGIVAL